MRNYIKLYLWLLFLTSTCFAQTALTINKKDGSKIVFNLDDIRKITFDNIVSIDEPKEIISIIKSFTLYQNYPNPFNPSTNIQYKLPKDGNVEIQVYNINGQIVKNIENVFKRSGSYVTTWNGKDDDNQSVSSGIYILQILYENQALSKKMMLIK